MLLKIGLLTQLNGSTPALWLLFCCFRLSPHLPYPWKRFQLHQLITIKGTDQSLLRLAQGPPPAPFSSSLSDSTSDIKLGVLSPSPFPSPLPFFFFFFFKHRFRRFFRSMGHFLVYFYTPLYWLSLLESVLFHFVYASGLVYNILMLLIEIICNFGMSFRFSSSS